MATSTEFFDILYKNISIDLSIYAKENGLLEEKRMEETKTISQQVEADRIISETSKTTILLYIVGVQTATLWISYRHAACK